VSGSVLGHGLRPVELSRVPARIEVDLRVQVRRLHHMGFRCQSISRNTLTNANATRPWQTYADFAQHLIGLARPLYAAEPFSPELDAVVYVFGASTIDSCLPVFARTPFRSTKAAIKLHPLLDLRVNMEVRFSEANSATYFIAVLI